MTGRVVLAVGADTGEEVVATAFRAAAERGVPLLAVRIWHDPDLPLGGWLRPERTACWDAAHHKARRELDSALERARAAHPDVEVATVVVDDDLVPFLAALSLRADLLVVGRSRRPGRQASPVDTLVRQAACSVLVVAPARVPGSGVSAADGPGSVGPTGVNLHQGPPRRTRRPGAGGPARTGRPAVVVRPSREAASQQP